MPKAGKRLPLTLDNEQIKFYKNCPNCYKNYIITEKDRNKIMGQVKRILASIEFIDNPIKNLNAESNVGPDGGPDHVHLQTEQWRLEFLESSFIHFANSIIIAASKLRKIKKI